MNGGSSIRDEELRTPRKNSTASPSGPSRSAGEQPSMCAELCLAFIESNFNISKVNENADGSYDYGLFQINSHYWCNDYKSHSENLCHVDCQDLLNPNLLAGIHCAKMIVSRSGGMNKWVEWRLHCSGRPLSYWMTGCRLE
ncbi:lysozyme-like protein 6 [Eulemur rufifrons]|uniref:lysozyme-like protein 6 n=1 Tax=Eulemur rufifrons TaxID=859984 RepID=UPI0037433902